MLTLAYFAGIVLQIVIRAPYDRQRRGAANTDQRVSATEQPILILLTIGGLLLPLLYAFTRWLGVADYPSSPATKTLLGGIGLLLLAALSGDRRKPVAIGRAVAEAERAVS